MSKSVAIITARGGSKRIPKKNIKDFCGKPIIAYSIEAAIQSKIFDEVMVSTDSEEIASLARYYGAVVPFMRSQETANDFATTSDVLLEVIGQYEKSNIYFDYGCCIYPTAPFVTKEKLQNAKKIIEDTNVNTVIPMVAFSYPPQRGIIIRGEKAELKYPEYIDTRSQDLEKIYHDCGQFYFFKVEKLKKEKKLMSKEFVPYIVSELEVQDIDTLSDWKLAELKYELMKEREHEV